MECTASTPIQIAIELACRALGRVPGDEESKIVEVLCNNWYMNAGDFISMADSEAAALGVPLRLKSMLKSMVSSNDGKVNSQEIFQNDAYNIEQEESNSGTHKLENPSASEVGPPGAKECESISLTASLEDTTGLEKASKKVWIPIEERICPPPNRFGFDVDSMPQVTKRTKAKKYALTFSEMHPELHQDFDNFFKFSTTRFFGQQSDPIAYVTAEKYADHIRGMLGWLHNYCKEPLSSLRLKSLVPTSKRHGVALAFEYQQWMSENRGAAMSTQLLFLRSLMQCAKFLYHNESSILPGSGEKPYSDLDVIKELRALISKASKSAKVAPRVAEESLKWLDWPEYLKLVGELEKEVAGIRPSGVPRSRSAVARSLQLYLMFAILASFPDRQRTLRELQFGKNLFKSDSRYIIKHSPKDYKTGKVYGERPPLVLPITLTPYLDEFINTWRKELNPKHDFLFCQVGGGPLTDKGLWKVFVRSAYRITGKRCHPHLVRDSVVTYLRSGNATEMELEALALLMGHSVEMQRNSYDRRTKEAKVGPAIALLENLLHS